MAYIIGRSLVNEYNYTTACILSMINVIILLGYLYITNRHHTEKIDVKTIIAGIFYTVSLILYLESMGNNLESTISVKNQTLLLLIFGIVLILMMLGHTVTKGETLGAFITIIGLLTIIKYSD